MHRNLIAAIALVAAAFSLAACTTAGSPTATPAGAGGAGAGGVATQAANGGGGGGGGGVANPSDPCSLITQQEASAAFGQSVTAGTNTQDSHECDWFYPDANSLTGGSITIQDGDLNSYCGKPSDPALGLTIQQVSGVGDGACFTYVTTTTIGSNLTFSKNGHVYTTAAFLGGGTPIDKVEAVAKALALAALGHL
jgi:hypothetical protein